MLPTTSSLIRAAQYEYYKGWIIGMIIYSLPIISTLLLSAYLGYSVAPIISIIITAILYVLSIIVLTLLVVFLFYLYYGDYSIIHRYVYMLLITCFIIVCVLQFVNLLVCDILFIVELFYTSSLIQDGAGLEYAGSAGTLTMQSAHSSCITPNNGEKFIPWDVTPSIVRAHSTLKTFFDWVPEGTPYREFLDKYCVTLIQPLPHLNSMENTGIPTTLFEKPNLLTSNGLVDCSKYIHNTNLPDSDAAMIYVFINKDNDNMYIGSSINMTGRLQTYSKSWDISPQRVMVEMRNTGGFSNYYFNPAYQIPNYRDLFDSLYPDAKFEPKFRYILDRFTEYHCRIVEQAVITHVKPEINDLTSNVSFSFPNVNIESYTPNSLDLAHPVSVFDTKGELINEYDSLNNAKRMLGVTRSALYWSRNRPGNFIWSEALQQDVYVFDHVINEVLSKPVHAYQKLMPVTGISLDSIPHGEIHAIMDNKSDLYGTYSSCSQFSEDHGLSKWGLQRYLNLEKAIPILGGTTLVYLCCNPAFRQSLRENWDKRNRPVVSIDTKDNNLVRYHDSPQSARVELDNILGTKPLKWTNGFTKMYIIGLERNNGPIRYRRRFRLQWRDEYES